MIEKQKFIYLELIPATRTDDNIEAQTNKHGILPRQIPGISMSLMDQTASNETNPMLGWSDEQIPKGDILVAENGNDPLTTSIASENTMLNSILCTLETQPLNSENFIQLRGTSIPRWFPGFFTAYPIGGSRVELMNSPVEILPKAWNLLQPS